MYIGKVAVTANYAEQMIALWPFWPKLIITWDVSIECVPDLKKLNYSECGNFQTSHIIVCSILCIQATIVLKNRRFEGIPTRDEIDVYRHPYGVSPHFTQSIKRLTYICYANVLSVLRWSVEFSVPELAVFDTYGQWIESMCAET